MWSIILTLAQYTCHCNLTVLILLNEVCFLLFCLTWFIFQSDSRSITWIWWAPCLANAGEVLAGRAPTKAVQKPQWPGWCRRMFRSALCKITIFKITSSKNLDIDRIRIVKYTFVWWLSFLIILLLCLGSWELRPQSLGWPLVQDTECGQTAGRCSHHATGHPHGGGKRN